MDVYYTFCRSYSFIYCGVRACCTLSIGFKNSKVFEQKGDHLNFKANIDPMAVLSQVKPGSAEPS